MNTTLSGEVSRLALVLIRMSMRVKHESNTHHTNIQHQQQGRWTRVAFQWVPIGWLATCKQPSWLDVQWSTKFPSAAADSREVARGPWHSIAVSGCIRLEIHFGCSNNLTFFQLQIPGRDYVWMTRSRLSTPMQLQYAFSHTAFSHTIRYKSHASRSTPCFSQCSFLHSIPFSFRLLNARFDPTSDLDSTCYRLAQFLITQERCVNRVIKSKYMKWPNDFRFLKWMKVEAQTERKWNTTNSNWYWTYPS